MTDFSLDIRNVLLSGGRDNLIDNCRNRYLSGDRSAIMTALMACSLYQWIIPDWVSDELLTLDGKLAIFELTDMNEFFGFKAKHASTISKEKRIKKYERVVLDALFNHRLDNGDFTTEVGLKAVADQTDVPRRIVEEVYKRNKEWLLKLPKNRNENVSFVKATGPALLELARHIRANIK